MNIRKTTGSSAAALAVLMAASVASAQLSDESTACRAAAAKSYAKVMKTALKVVTGCHKAKDKGDTELTSVNCNDIDAADTKGKFEKARVKHIETVAGACGAATDSELTSANNAGKEWYISCSVDPCYRADGTTEISNPMTTMDDVGACQACEAAATAEEIGTETLGSPPQMSLSAEDQKCRGAISKGYSKYLNTALKNDTACQTAADEADTNDYTACEDGPDPKNKVSGALTKANEGLASACVGANYANMMSCGADLATLQTCNAAAWGDGEDDAYTSIYELPTNVCPNAIRTTILGGCSTGDTGGPDCALIGKKSSTSLSVGWKGLAHKVDIIDNYTLAGNITCGGTLGQCATPICAGGTSPGTACTDNNDCTNGNTCQDACLVTGISYDNPQYDDFTRCRTDTSIPCTNKFGVDPVCTSTPGSLATSNECSYYLGPPLAVSAGGSPTCSLNQLRQDVTGTVDPDAGTSTLNVALNTDVHLGDLLTRPCAICRGDETAQDGVKEGVCLGGLRDGDPCDVQGFDLTFARIGLDPGNPTEGNSLDCPPDPAKSIGSLKINLPLTTGTATKTAEDPCESPNQTTDCFCGMCGAGLGFDACDNDQFCDMLDDNTDNDSDTCDAVAPGEERLPNACNDGICTPSGGATDIGICNSSSFYCDGHLTSDGKGVIVCANNASCASQTSESSNPDEWTCEGNDCGNCTISAPRSCFLTPTISLTGTPDVDRPILVGAFCLPPSGNGAVNETTGSPGPAVVRTDSFVEKRY